MRTFDFTDATTRKQYRFVKDEAKVSCQYLIERENIYVEAEALGKFAQIGIRALLDRLDRAENELRRVYDELLWECSREYPLSQREALLKCNDMMDAIPEEFKRLSKKEG